MKITELSIGDWVMIEGAPTKVWYLSEDGEVNDTTYDIEPIHLTPEILEKNGLERKKYTIDIAEAQEIEYDGYRHILCQDSVQYDIILVDSFGGYFDLEIENSCRDDAGERILISSRLSLDYVEFVHQLQHALRLAGVEKDIEL